MAEQGGVQELNHFCRLPDSSNMKSSLSVGLPEILPGLHRDMKVPLVPSCFLPSPLLPNK